MTTMPLRWHHRDDRQGLSEAREAVRATQVQKAHTRAQWPFIQALAQRARRAGEELAQERERNHFGQMARDALGRN